MPMMDKIQAVTQRSLFIDVTGGSDDLANGKIGSIPEDGLSIRLRGKKAPWHTESHLSDNDVKIYSILLHSQV